MIPLLLQAAARLGIATIKYYGKEGWKKGAKKALGKIVERKRLSIDNKKLGKKKGLLSKKEMAQKAQQNRTFTRLSIGEKRT